EQQGLRRLPTPAGRRRRGLAAAHPRTAPLRLCLRLHHARLGEVIRMSRHRAKVEHPTGMMKQQLGYRRVRYRGHERNAFDFALVLTACNLKRSLSLTNAA
ncbi:MAG: transposase, partial [Planctomyces sp.]